MRRLVAFASKLRAYWRLHALFLENFAREIDLSAFIWYNNYMDNTRKLFREIAADAMLTGSADLRTWLTGFPSSFGYVYTDAQESVLFTDPRYAEAAKAALGNTFVGVEIARDESVVLDYIKSKKVKKLAVPFERLTFLQYKILRKRGFKPVDSTPAFVAAMSVKDEYELSCIRKACSIAEQAYARFLGELREGMDENEAAGLLEYCMRRLGAEDRSFETIVAFGRNSSVPHHRPGETKLACGMPVLADFGCKYKGYCSDMTRTALFGRTGAPEDFCDTYEAVRGAHAAAVQGIRAGMLGKEADAFARVYLQQRGLDKFFTHSLGHGIGINIHEAPVLGPSGGTRLQDGMVFSIEPGVYFEGRFGIRIEDTAVLSGGTVSDLMRTDTSLTVL